MAYERMTPKAIEDAAARIKDLSELDAFIDGIESELEQTATGIVDCRREVGTLASRLDQADADFRNAGSEVIEMWKDVPPRE
ncbi:hypothetical protein HY969_02090 [Candidatus Kaiserbacteria bacterium]|nr:hypothetical protein [Candidatus Kaiserbacteria bacterium]